MYISKIKSGIPKNSIFMPIDTSTLEFCNHSYMCIKQEGSSEYRIPENLQLIVDTMLSGIYQVSRYLYDNSYTYNCYLTIRHEYVNPGSFGNRPGWHIDGFKSDQHNFIWMDILPTDVCDGEFRLSNDHYISLNEMMEQSCENDKFVRVLDVNTLYEMDQSCVHQPAVNNIRQPRLRTFIKFTFSREQFNAFGNAWNYKIPHIRPTQHRHDSRNHGVI